MVANRRLGWNFALQRAVEWCRELDRPLIILEALRCGYPWASPRLHRFVLDGMQCNRSACAGSSVRYYPYVEPVLDAGKGLLEALAQDACVVVTDDFPCFIVPAMTRAAAERVPVRLEDVDSNGLLPMRSTEQVFPTAYALRRFLQKHLAEHLAAPPAENPLGPLKRRGMATLPREVERRWPEASDELLAGSPAALAALPLDHSVPVTSTRGGADAAARAMTEFLDHRLSRYAEDRNQPERAVTSELSPYLHFGHVSVHQVVDEVLAREEWSIEDLPATGNGSRAGWWQVGENAEGFLDELVTWRELGFNLCAHRDDYARYESLPDWAQKTLDEHASDPREPSYDLEQFDRAATHDELWNAAQTQLVREGRIHNYLRMLWGKKILEWSRTPRDALATMIELNNRYALDGRNPNSYSGIFWVLGRYDRPWGPERKVFGKIRYMSSENTARKVSLRGYLERYSSAAARGCLDFG
ncbi:MAG: deoxyribodipyrimidine photolyase [Planctomycetota bacterium]